MMVQKNIIGFYPPSINQMTGIDSITKIPDAREKASMSEILTGRYKDMLLEDLAKEYRIQLDDPQGGEKYYDYLDTKINTKTVGLDTSISRPAAVAMFFKREQYRKSILKEKGIAFFEGLWKKNLSEKGYEFCKDMYEKYDIITLADPKILDYFSRIMGTVYNGNALGKFSIVRSRSSVEHRSGRIKHEGIHGKQGGTKKRLMSFIDMLRKRNELNGLVPRSIDYATDNQISDRETYINQYKQDPIKDVKPYEFEKYKMKENRFKAIKDHMQTDIDELKQDIAALKQKITEVREGRVKREDDDRGFTNAERAANLSYLLTSKERDLQTMETLQRQHDDTEDRHQFITFGEQDGYIYQETPEKRQTNFQSENSFRKHVAIDMFITHYGEEKDNYKKGVDIYEKYRENVLAIANEYAKNKDKKLLKAKMAELFKEIG